MLESIKQSGALRRLHSMLAAACAFFMLVFVPLVFRNALFDINRVKVDAVLIVIPVFLIASVLGIAMRRGYPALSQEALTICIPLFSFAFAAIISSARRGFSDAVLFGTDGRMCGLLFLLACVCAFYIIVLGHLKGSVIAAFACAAAAIAAVLGVLNSMGIDPLGFYSRMQKGQWHLFLSTIGNVDFFGCYLALMLPISTGGCINAKRKTTFCYYLFISLCVMAGIAASRADSAILSAQLGMLVLLAFSGDSYKQLSKVLFLWAAFFASLAAVYRLLLKAKFYLPLSGVFLALCKRPVSMIACVVLMLCAACALFAHKRGWRAPGIKRLSLALSSAVIVLAAAVLVLMVYFTVYEPDVELGALSSLIRFDDHWGTRRGFVYRRSIRAFCGFSPMDVLFGQGVDCTRHILEPYFDNPDMLVHGSFNDAHCQPLQYLLTTGIMGAGSLIAFHLLLLASVCRRSVSEPRFAGFCAALVAYIPIALLNVAQPILIAVYFSVCAVAVSMIQYSAAKEGNP